jgi:hypothetical protein
MQQLFRLLIFLKSALCVSGDKFAHPQEHYFHCIYSVWYNAPTLLPAAATVEMERQADFKKINKRKIVASCWLLTSLC